MLFSCSVGYRASTSVPLFRQFHDGVLGSSQKLVSNSSPIHRDRIIYSLRERHTKEKAPTMHELPPLIRSLVLHSHPPEECP